MATPYATLEAEGGAPLELLRLVSGSTVYTYTSGDIPVTFNAGAGSETYVPGFIKRGSVLATSEPTKLQLDVGMGVDTPVAPLFVNGIAPGPVTLALYRFQRGADLSGGLGTDQIVWSYFGQVAGATWNGSEVKVAVTPAQRNVEQTIPRFRVQRQCNFALYDAGCTILKSAFTLPGTIATIDLTGTVIGITMGATAQAVPYYAGGLLNTAGGLTGFIENHDNSTGTLLTVSLLVPIPGLTVGASVTLNPGCDRSFQTCVQKFANGDNFLGAQDLVAADPWVSGIRTDSTT